MRIIKLEGACNCRDVGGYVTGDGRFQVAYGKLYRSDQLSGLNQRDLAILEQLGIRTVVDYRLPREYQRAANSQWPALKNIVHLVPDAEAVETAAAASNDHEKVDKLLRQAEAKKQIINGSGLVMEQQNRDFVNSPQVTRVYRQLLELLLEQENLPLLQECRGGKDRTGFGVAIAEAHPAIRAGEDVLFTDDAAVEVTTEVDQCLLAAANRFAVPPPIPADSTPAGQCRPPRSPPAFLPERPWPSPSR